MRVYHANQNQNSDTVSFSLPRKLRPLSIIEKPTVLLLISMI
ncbi:Uncharacterised protein [Vibrio cholerae]|nr:Uncharacterised protein [Vibrio cholerae]